MATGAMNSAISFSDSAILPWRRHGSRFYDKAGTVLTP
jgi:hypothetical protein